MNQKPNHRSCRPTHRGFIFLCVVAFAFRASDSVSAEVSKSENGKSSNILFIAIDDLRPQLGAYGDESVKSPNLDRFAEQATVFDRAYCQQPICMASRASLFTGYRPDHQRIYSCLSVNELLPDAITINQWLGKHGYDIKATGKIYHFGEDYRLQFGDRYCDPKGTWTGKGYLHPDNIELIKKRLQDESINEKDRTRGPAYERADVEDEAYSDGLTARFGVQSLEKFAASDQQTPFFLALGFRKPHLPFNAPAKYWDLYDEANLPMASFASLPENATEYTSFSSGELRNYVGVPKDRTVPIPDDLGRKLVHGYLASVSYVDAQVGRVLDALESNGLADNTTVIIWGDHGYKLGEYSMWGKHTPFELDARIPLMIKPAKELGFHKPGKARGLVETVDLYPTICDLAGLPLPEHLQGQSLRPILANPEHAGKAGAFTEWPKSNRTNPEKVVTALSLRTDQFRYTEWTKRSTGEVLAVELYDHQIDPGEQRNVAAETQYADQVAKLSEMLDKGKGWQKLPKLE